MQIEIIEKIDEDEIIAKGLGHDLYCYEVAVEILWEQERITDEADAEDEITADIAEGKYQCRCDEAE